MADLKHGTLIGFSGSWGSGIGYLRIEDDEMKRVISVPCENGATVRALHAAFGNVIQPGHHANAQAGLGRRIVYEVDELGMLAGFTPEEEVEA